MFRALVLEKSAGGIVPSIETLSEDRLPAGDVLVSVDYSTVNYKDGLVLAGLGNLVKTYPHVPGIDFTGTVSESRHDAYRAGQKIVLTGWRVGELHWGGYAQKARVSADQILPLPASLSTLDAMAVGTAGLTAMLSVMALEEQGLRPGQGPVLVTGATGGVGSVATAILANLGYTVVASTGKAEMEGYLRELGASEVVDRRVFADASTKPLERETWAGCIESVGGTTLPRVLAQMKYSCAVAAVGLVGGSGLEATVLPFILRGVRLIGIDSVMCPNPRRREAWARIAADLPLEKLRRSVSVVSLAEVPDVGGRILKGQLHGRIVVDVNA